MFKSKSIQGIEYIVLGLGSVWIFFNIYFLPFFAWTTGIVRSWLIMHGYLPYRDFTWMRAPFDLFFLSNWFKVFGAKPESYQLLIFTILVVISIIVYFTTRDISPRIKFIPYLFFIIFLFPLFQNPEMGEAFVGLWSILLFVNVFLYLNKRNVYILMITGLISGISLITKQNSGGLIIIMMITIILDTYLQKKGLFIYVKRCFFYILGLSIPILLLISYFLYHGGLGEFLYDSIFIVLGPYRKYPLPPGFSIGEGLWIEAAYFALLVPFLIFHKDLRLSTQKVVFLTLLIIALFPSLLPSYISYRAFTSFPIMAIIVGYNAYLFINNQNKNSRTIKRFIILISFLAFILLSLRFIPSYISSYSNQEIKLNNFIKDYGKPEYEVIDWIKKNTQKDEKIMSFTSDIVYFSSNRFPKNKYMDSQPFTLLYTDSAETYIKNPPKIFVIDQLTIDTFPDLKKWKFLNYLKNNYSLKKQFETLKIYQLNIK